MVELTMTKQCPECKRVLELNTLNFRCSCDGFWRNTCRDCQNKRKRWRYEHVQKTQTTGRSQYRQAQEQRLDALIAKYDAIFETLARLGISPDAPADLVDQVLEESQRKAAC
jgi:hypothetical protein